MSADETAASSSIEWDLDGNTTYETARPQAAAASADTPAGRHPVQTVDTQRPTPG